MAPLTLLIVLIHDFDDFISSSSGGGATAGRSMGEGPDHKCSSKRSPMRMRDAEKCGQHGTDLSDEMILR
jgi:hypothetical protein